jgi:hypothetical protein
MNGIHFYSVNREIRGDDHTTSFPLQHPFKARLIVVVRNSDGDKVNMDFAPSPPGHVTVTFPDAPGKDRRLMAFISGTETPLP